MDFMGKVKEITTDGKLIVQCSEAPEIGAAVYDSGQNRMGIVRRVFGPVSAPYASVETMTAATETMKETDLYTKGGSKHGKDKRRSRRD